MLSNRAYGPIVLLLYRASGPYIIYQLGILFLPLCFGASPLRLGGKKEFYLHYTAIGAWGPYSIGVRGSHSLLYIGAGAPMYKGARDSISLYLRGLCPLIPPLYIGPCGPI